MEIIPVIDLLQGKVVRAQCGERSRYLPIQTPLCNSSQPTDIAQALLGLYPFKTLYIADLDAIQKLGDNVSAVRLLAQQHPTVSFWVDGGLGDANEWPYAGTKNIRCVIGSETLATLDHYTTLASSLVGTHPLLSLDFNAKGLIGPSALLQPEHWPDSVICMTLGKVGSYEGPDVQLLADLVSQHPKGKVFAAGGIRNFDDLQRLKTMGVSGALVASSLHDGHLLPTHIAQLTT